MTTTRRALPGKECPTPAMGVLMRRIVETFN